MPMLACSRWLRKCFISIEYAGLLCCPARVPGSAAWRLYSTSLAGNPSPIFRIDHRCRRYGGRSLLCHTRAITRFKLEEHIETKEIALHDERQMHSVEHSVPELGVTVKLLRDCSKQKTDFSWQIRLDVLNTRLSHIAV